ncbi:hypothetical protein BD769DRAFT_1386147 [Suillus cothurnatus]|nr:hypothetical protein BD769DRAFT_1386147 [Suillus cothurnatus]
MPEDLIDDACGLKLNTDQITQTDTETAHAGQHKGSNSGPGDVVDHDDWVPTSIDDRCWGDTSNNLLGSMEPMCLNTSKGFMVVAGDSTEYGFDMPAKSKLSARDAQKDIKNVKPHVHAFLLDPKRDDFISTHIQSHHDELLAIANFIAFLMCAKGLPDDVIPGASSLMSIDIWLTEIAQECKQATNMDTFMLPPLAHCILLEISTLTKKDEKLVQHILQTNIWDKNWDTIVKPVILYLCKLHGSKPGADDKYASGFKVLAHIMQSNWVQV